jgi:hypothetical protein
MAPRLDRALEKLEKYTKKLADSPYYLAARVLNPQCRTTFLAEGFDGKKVLFLVRELWKKHRDKMPLSSNSSSYETREGQAPEKELSAFQAAHKKRVKKATRPSSDDEFETYIKDGPIQLNPDDLPPRTKRKTSLEWWCEPNQRSRFPRLSILAINILSMPGMSDKPERVFSGSRRRVSWDRTKTTAKTLEACECSKDWSDQKILYTSMIY